MFGLNLKSGAKEAAVQGAIEGTSIGAQLVEDATGVPVATLLEAGMTMKDLMDAANDKKTVTNPYLLARRLGENGESSKATAHYLRKRSVKKIGSIAYDVAGKGVQMGLDAAGFGMGGVDAMGLAKHGTAEVSTIAHLTRLTALSRKVKQSKYLQGLIFDLMKVKGAKAGYRGGKIAAAVIPNTIASTAVSVTVSIAGAGAQAMLKDLICKAACEIHWRAYQELTIGRIAGGGYGPACRMVQELFNHTYSTGWVPTDTVRNYMREPAGWMVIHDKLSLM